MFANDPWDWGSMPGRVMRKTQKMVLDASLLNTQHYTVQIKVKLSNPGKRITVTNFTYIYIKCIYLFLYLFNVGVRRKCGALREE